MIVFDLKCATGHVFEAWFGSSAAYDAQAAAGQVRCPLCDSAEVVKAVMAPNIAPKAGAAAPPELKAAFAKLAAMQAEALKGSEWVGRSFATRARAMHMGEEKQAVIHGQTTPAEAKALVEEGVPVAPLPLPVTPPERLN